VVDFHRAELSYPGLASKLGTDFEFVVSSEEGVGSIRNPPPGFVFTSNTSDRGYTNNLISLLASCSGKYVMFLGQDDKFRGELLCSFIEYLETSHEANSPSVIFTSLNRSRGGLQRSNWVRVPFYYSFMRSGASPGLALRQEEIGGLLRLAEDWKFTFPEAIYPQVWMAAKLWTEGVATYFDGCDISQNASKSMVDEVESEMGRPDDYGILERLLVLRRLWREKHISLILFFRARVGLYAWAAKVNLSLQNESKSYSESMMRSWISQLPKCDILLIRVFMSIERRILD
jgi:hypothetical protein